MRLDVERKLTEARTALVLSEPFFGQLALRLRLESNDTIKTARTNGLMLHVNQDWVMDMPAAELRGVLAHEVMHCGMGHASRRHGRDIKRWNEACDHAVNLELLKAGFLLPKGHLADSRFEGKSAESIFTLLEAEQRQRGAQGGGKPKEGQGQPQAGQGHQAAGNPPATGPQGDDLDPGGCGGVEDAPAEDGGIASEAELEANAREWEVAVAQAAQAAKGAGKLPGALDRLAKALVNPKQDWKEVLRRFCVDKAQSESTWSRPNRRMVAQGIYFPSSKPVGMGQLAVIIDVSGSIDQAQLDRFATELNAIAEDTVPASIRLIYCDTKVTSDQTYLTDEYPVTIRAQGGGGTDMGPAFQRLAESDDQPVAIVCLTDLDFGSRWPADPGIPTLWAATGRRNKAPWGEVVSVD